jgi:ADP-heptose:LPS heptosyltransferase
LFQKALQKRSYFANGNLENIYSMNIFKKNINALRRGVMHRITKNIGKSYADVSTGPIGNNEIQRILISRPNKRLGNLLLITPLLQEVITTFPKSKIDLFVKGNLALALFKNYENIDRIIQLPEKAFKNLIKYIRGWVSIKRNHYDLVINVVNNSSSGRLSAQFAHSKYKFFGDLNEEVQGKYTDCAHIAKFPVYAFRTYLMKMGFIENDNPVPGLNLRLSPFEIAEGQKKLKELVNNDKKTICLFTHATGDKCYSTSWWENFYRRLKAEYPDYNIIEVLPVQNISKISFKAPTFSSKEVREVGSLIANTELFICADGGMMHLGSSVLTPTIGLFSVTSRYSYQPYNDHSMGIDTGDSSIDEWMEAINKILSSRTSL